MVVGVISNCQDLFHHRHPEYTAFEEVENRKISIKKLGGERSPEHFGAV